jgi:N-acetylglucosamine kinase-like BadF-type ATPase
VAVVAGTSNNCWGRAEDGREGRVIGGGATFAEYGGSGELVGYAVQVVAKAWSQRGPATGLTDAFIHLTGARDVDDLLEGLTLGHYRIDATAAPLVFEVAAAGDQVAIEAIRWAGEELAGLANGVIRQLGFASRAFEVILVGSLYNGGPLLVEPMRQAIQAVAPGARLVRLSAPPVVGAVLLAMEQAGIRPAAVREQLLQSTQQLRAAERRLPAVPVILNAPPGG